MRPRITHHHDPSTPLLAFSKSDIWTLNDAFMGTVILGGTGSGKTSGSGQALASGFLRAGMGGLVLCAKPDERALWERYARQYGRERSLLVVDGRNGQHFNFLEYELNRADSGRSTFNAVAMFMRILEATRTNRGGGGDGNFWEDAVKELLSHAIDAL